MKIAYFTSNRTTFPPQSDQIAASIEVTMSIVKHLSKKHEITLYAAKGSHMENVHVVDLGLEPFSIDSNLSNSDWTTKAVLGMKQLYIGEILKNAENYDLIHIQTEPVYLAMPYIHLVRKPILFTTHNSYHDFEKDLFHFYDGKIHLSALSQKQAKSFPLKQEVPVIYNGIEIDEFPFNNTSENYFLFLGRLVKEKGIETIINLIESTNYNIYVAGKGNVQYENKLKELSVKKNNFKFYGMVTYKSEKWFQLLSQAKALLMPIEYNDPCPLVPLEAMACGTPVIAYDNGALPEQVIDGETGYIISSRHTNNQYIIKSSETDGLIEAINSVSSESIENYTKFRQNCRTHIKNKFTAEKMAIAYDQLYSNIVMSNKLLK